MNPSYDSPFGSQNPGGQTGVPGGMFPNGQMPNNQVPNSQILNNQMPNAQMPDSQMSNVQLPNAQMPNNQMLNNQMSTPNGYFPNQPMVPADRGDIILNSNTGSKNRKWLFGILFLFLAVIVFVIIALIINNSIQNKKDPKVAYNLLANYLIYGKEEDQTEFSSEVLETINQDEISFIQNFQINSNSSQQGYLDIANKYINGLLESTDNNGVKNSTNELKEELDILRYLSGIAYAGLLEEKYLNDGKIVLSFDSTNIEETNGSDSVLSTSVFLINMITEKANNLYSLYAENSCQANGYFNNECISNLQNNNPEAVTMQTNLDSDIIGLRKYCDVLYGKIRGVIINIGEELNEK